ncbi:hypothetical protein BJV82DRAFT_156716 [Fennellomyces sp. T-0311]|nr:hypothetical protein BJV82DRAFT_156716 [Fennellomyces sp. T-0311]
MTGHGNTHALDVAQKHFGDNSLFLVPANQMSGRKTMATHWNQASRNPTQVRPLLIRPQPIVSAISKSLDIPQQKRTRAKHCCDSCRERRIRCNAESVQPCHGCRKFGVECNFSKDCKPSAKYIRSVESRILHLESVLNKRMGDALTTKRRSTFGERRCFYLPKACLRICQCNTGVV